MKPFITGMAMFLLSMVFTVYQHDYNLHQEQIYNLKFAAEESAAAAAQYLFDDGYSEGMLVFNQLEGEKAARYILQEQLKLDDNLVPRENSYWQEQIQYTIEFLDDSNTVFPYLYEHSTASLVLTLTEPTVIIAVNTGKPRYRIFSSLYLPSSIRVAAYELKER